MKKISLSHQTIEVLKNFATIQPNILFVPGNEISTIAEQKNVFATAVVEEQFDVKFGIYDLNNFLAILSSFEKPTLQFSEEVGVDGCAKYVVVSDEASGYGKFKYFGSNEKLLTKSSGGFKMPEIVVDFDISKGDLSRILKAGQVGQLKDLIFESKTGKTIDLVATNLEIDTSNEFRLPLCDNPSDTKFSMVLNASNVKLIGGNYKISLDGKLVARFANVDKNIAYHIAVERTSTYGE